jgi:hypothetical protein
MSNAAPKKFNLYSEIDQECDAMNFLGKLRSEKNKGKSMNNTNNLEKTEVRKDALRKNTQVGCLTFRNIFKKLVFVADIDLNTLSFIRQVGCSMFIPKKLVKSKVKWGGESTM